MKKNILITVLVLLSVTFLFYAKLKANEAIQNQIEAQANVEIAQKEAERADINKRKAEQAAAEAIMAQGEAERLMVELQKCQSK